MDCFSQRTCPKESQKRMFLLYLEKIGQKLRPADTNIYRFENRSKRVLEARIGAKVMVPGLGLTMKVICIAQFCMEIL